MRFAVPPFSPKDDSPCFCRSGKVFAQCCGDRSGQRSLPAGIQVFRNFLDAETCQKWVKRLEKQSRVQATTTDINSTRQGMLTFKNNPARVCENVNPGAMRPRILEVIERGYQQAVAGTGHTLAWFEFPNILRYEPGGFYRKHADSCLLEKSDQTWYKIQDRDLSLLLYLNEDFEGGGLTFVNFNFHFRPKAGDLLVFPSDNRYEHQAEKVEAGLRYCIASWAALQGTRKVFDKPPQSAVPFTHQA
jgi:predicted 2-oxoglutarate/Fe(II)-dependent dioxygenase YbiX